jgi:hypothetical protein
MRMISLIVAFCFSFNVMASTGTLQEFERLLDNYHYDLTVEWNQKDQNFYNLKTQDFFSQTEKLIRDKGLSEKDIISIVENKSSNKELIEAMTLKFSMMKNFSLEEMLQSIKASSKDMYSEGASWNGYWIAPVAMILIIGGIIGYSVWWGNNHVCVETDTRYICRSHNNCYPSSNHYGQTCYSNYTTCGYQEVCTNYEKK